LCVQPRHDLRGVVAVATAAEALMAGSFQHCLDDDGNYRGHDLLENMHDMGEAVEQMAFMLLRISQVFGGESLIEMADREYYECLRGERLWPDYMKPGIER
jgi:hypothetical protein